jgi:hypothetical protein
MKKRKGHAHTFEVCGEAEEVAQRIVNKLVLVPLAHDGQDIVEFCGAHARVSRGVCKKREGRGRMQV